jgi:hypothetical protein
MLEFQPLLITTLLRFCPQGNNKSAVSQIFSAASKNLFFSPSTSCHLLFSQESRLAVTQHELHSSQFCSDGLGQGFYNIGLEAVNGLVGQCAVLIPEP